MDFEGIELSNPSSQVRATTTDDESAPPSAAETTATGTNRIMRRSTIAPTVALTIKLIVPTAPGGGTDGYFRILAKEATPFIKDTIVIINVPGAGRMGTSA